MKAAMYLRVSTEEQRERQSIATQRTFAESYCKTHDIIPYGWYEDDGVSGTIPLEQRLEGARLLADARASKIDTIFVYKIDRLGRDSLLILNTVNALESIAVQVKSMTEPFDTSNPPGRFLLTILSGVAGLERDTIIQRSMEGSNRLARQGVWLGGIVPYGYQVKGKDRDSHLVISEQSIPGFTISEADIVLQIYLMTAEERKSCFEIATYLNALGVPPAYTRDARTILKGKHKTATMGLWRPGSIRSIIVNTTYKGIHQYGKHSKKQREVIEREVPAIVSVELWERAQEVLHEHMLFSPRNAKRAYLLHGLIKCALCGLTYVGTAYPVYKGGVCLYYVCNGKQQARHLYGPHGKKCPSKAVNGELLEAAIWQDIEQFLLKPGEVLDRLAAQMHERAGEVEQLGEEIAHLQQRQQAMKEEQDRVITLFRRGRIDEATLDRQLDQIQQDEGSILKQLEQAQELLKSVHNVEAGMRSAEELLHTLHQRLEEPLTWELKRQLIERLVERITVQTVEDEKRKKETRITVIYRFGASLAL